MGHNGIRSTSRWSRAGDLVGGLVAVVAVVLPVLGGAATIPLERAGVQWTLYWVLVGAAVAAVVAMPPRRWLAWAPWTFVACWAVLLAWMPHAVAVAPDARAADIEVRRFLLAMLLSLVALGLTRGSRAGLGGLRVGWLVSLALSVGLGWWEILTKDHLLFLDPKRGWVFGDARLATGTFLNPNNFATALVGMIVGALALRAGLTGRWRWLALPIDALVVAGAGVVVFTQSRSGLGALAVVGLLEIWRRLPGRRAWWAGHGAGRLPGAEGAVTADTLDPADTRPRLDPRVEAVLAARHEAAARPATDGDPADGDPADGDPSDGGRAEGQASSTDSVGARSPGSGATVPGPAGAGPTRDDLASSAAAAADSAHRSRAPLASTLRTTAGAATSQGDALASAPGRPSTTGASGTAAGRPGGPGTQTAGSGAPRRWLWAAGACVAALVVAAFTIPALAARNPLVQVAAMAGDEETTRSDSLRLQLIAAALRYLRDSGWTGSGAGSFEPLLWADPDPGVLKLTNLHNAFVELLSQYGIVVGGVHALALLALVTVVALPLPGRLGRWRRASADPGAAPPRRRGLPRDTRIEIAGYLSAYVCLGVAASSALTLPVWWLLHAAACASWWAAAADSRCVAAAPDQVGDTAVPHRANRHQDRAVGQRARRHRPLALRRAPSSPSRQQPQRRALTATTSE